MVELRQQKPNIELSGEEIHYLVVISLYTYFCKYGKLPVVNLTVYVGPDCLRDCLDTKGFIKSKVIPPRKLYYPVFPYKNNSKLMFPLCSACADTMNQCNCIDPDEEHFIF